MKEYIKYAERVDLTKLDTRKKSKIKGIPKLYDANLAGTKKASECTLILTEGDSAKTMAISGLSAIPKGNNTYGVFPLKGKLLNVRDAPHKKIITNEEFKNLKKIMGFEINKVYNEKNISELRYGSIMLMMDADVDGSHIKGLFINMIHYYWPSLLKIDGFIKNFITPIVKVTYKTTKDKEGNPLTESFYTQQEYDEWKKSLKPKDVTANKYTVKYYKGLGTSTAEEAREYFGNLDKHLIDFKWVSSSDASIELAFAKDKADARKMWLKGYDKDDILDFSVRQFSYKDFINKELIHFSNYDNIRSIPNLIDGLKPSQRKVLFGSFKRNLTEDVKVAQLVGYISEHTSYHHGEVSLANTIIAMAQNFVGSNNLNMLTPKGQYGCIDPNTPVLMWDSTIKKAKEIRVNDKLIGDNGTIRTVSKITSGMDDMYEIKNGGMDNYTVNSNHILTVSYSGHKSIFWKESAKSWNVNYFDKESKSVKSKSFSTKLTSNHDHYNKSKLTKNEAHKQIIEFAKAIPDDNVFDINIQDYLKLPKHAKHKIKGVLNSSVVRWKKQNIDIDPYILGVWLGDGMSDCHAFSSEDPEIIKSWVIWLDKIGCEVVHCENYNGNESYSYYIRRRGSSKGNYAIGDINHSNNNCKGCLTSKNKLSICDWTYNKEQNEFECNGENIKGHTAINLNPFKELFKKNKLFKNKHVPKQYIINNKNNRLQLLAGMIDSDGTLRRQGNNYRYEIFQHVERKHLIESFRIIAGSLGYRAKVWKYGKMMTLAISGYGLENIPTRVARKQISANKLKCNPMIHNLEVKHIGKGKFCGWNIDRNERFLLGDFTVTHNTRLMGGKDHSSPRYIYTKLEQLARLIFHKDDDPLLNYLNDDGFSIEPSYYVPVIPMVLVNGAEGIGTGYSTYIPKFNPLELIEYLENRLTNKKQTTLIKPWYDGFTGIIAKKEQNIYITKGTYEVNKADLKITELPVTTWTESYKVFLEATIAERKYIRRVTNNSTESTVDFTIRFTDEQVLNNMTKSTKSKTVNDLEQNFGLVKTINMNNMHLYNSEGKIQRYNNVNKILEEFYTIRLEFYGKRKAYLLKKLEKEISVLASKMKFISLIVDKKINLFNKSREDMVKILDKQKLVKLEEELAYDYLIRLSFYSLTKEKISELDKQLKGKRAEYNNLKKKKIEELWIDDLNAIKRAIVK